MEYFRVLVIGERGTGKTSLIQRVTSDTFLEAYQETNKIKHLTYELEGQTPTKVMFSDSPGHFSQLTKEETRVDAYILLFDLTDLVSFTKLGEWLEKMEQFYGPRPMVIVGNKSDLDGWMVDRDQIIEFIDELHHIWELEMHFCPIKYLKVSVLRDPKKSFDLVLTYLAEQSYRALKKEGGEWDYPD